MIKGLHDNLDVILNDNELPVILGTTLLMFKGNIVYNSFVSTYPISIDNRMREMIIKESKATLNAT